MPPPAEFTLFGLSPLMPLSQGGHASISSTATCHHRTPEPFGMLLCIPPAPAPVPEPVPQLPAIDVAALLAQLQQLAATMQALQHQNTVLQDQLNAQAVAAAPPTPPAPALAFVPEIRIAMPDVFDSALDHTEHFLHQCEVYFLGTPGLTAQQCMTFTLSYMSKGQALSWAEQMLKTVAHPDHIANWGIFKRVCEDLSVTWTAS
jgi:hypothetical protein